MRGRPFLPPPGGRDERGSQGGAGRLAAPGARARAGTPAGPGAGPPCREAARRGARGRESSLGSPVLLLLGLVLLGAGCRGGVPAAVAGPPVLELAELDGGEILGVGPEVTRETPDGFRLRFRGPRDGMRAALAYARSRVAGDAPVEIRLNGVPVSRVDPSDAFRTAPEVLLPPALLRGDDEISFVPTAPGTWQVGEIRVVEDALPACAPRDCELRARELFDRAALLHADRAVAAGNLARAVGLLREALLHVEHAGPAAPPASVPGGLAGPGRGGGAAFGLPAPGGQGRVSRTAAAGADSAARYLRGRIASLLAEASRELDATCRGLRFAALGHVHLGRWAEVRATALVMADRFPQAPHPCHGTARRLLERLAELEEP